MDLLQNNPLLWRDKLPRLGPAGHKYDRGVAVIAGAPKMTGATRLAARACARMGAGLVRVVAPDGTGAIYRTALPEEIIVDDHGDFKGFDDERMKAFVAGPGTGIDETDLDMIQEALDSGIGVVLDAGAFAVWMEKSDPARLVVTPHEGEFAKKFGQLNGSKEERAQRGAREMGAVMILKGARTVIAAPEGDIIVQERDTPELATAGTGDVLAGMIGGLLAQGVAPLWAGAAAVWVHAEAAHRYGRGLVSSDLPDLIPSVLKNL